MMYLYSNHIPTFMYNMLSVSYTNITYLCMLISIYYTIRYTYVKCLSL